MNPETIEVRYDKSGTKWTRLGYDNYGMIIQRDGHAQIRISKSSWYRFFSTTPPEPTSQIQACEVKR